MAENMYSPGQKVPTDKFRDNFDKTFGNKKGHCNGSRWWKLQVRSG
jgi:hypothetical protein